MTRSANPMWIRRSGAVDAQPLKMRWGNLRSSGGANGCGLESEHRRRRPDAGSLLDKHGPPVRGVLGYHSRTVRAHDQPDRYERGTISRIGEFSSSIAHFTAGWLRRSSGIAPDCSRVVEGGLGQLCLSIARTGTRSAPHERGLARLTCPGGERRSLPGH